MTKEEIASIAEQAAKDNAVFVKTGSMEFRVADWPEDYNQEMIKTAVDSFTRGVSHIINLIEYDYKITKK